MRRAIIPVLCFTFFGLSPRTRRRLLSFCSVTAVLLLLAGVPLRAQTDPRYTYLTIDDPNAFQSASFGTGTTAAGVNDQGTVVGFFYDQNLVVHGFKLEGGNFTTFDFPSASTFRFNGTVPSAINNAGSIVGMYQDTGGVCHGFLFAGGNFSSIDFPGAAETLATAINNAGDIVGFYFIDGITAHGFLLKAGHFTTVDLLGATSTFPFGINDSGVIVGNYNSPFGGQLLGFQLNGATITAPISFPNAQGTQILGINDAGEIVGAYFNSSNFSTHGLLLSNGNFTTIDPPGSVFTAPNAINGAGQIVGFFEDSQQFPRGFLASRATLVDPVPDLLNGPAVVKGLVLQTLGLFGRPVQGVAADGVTQVVVRIPAKNVGDQFTLTLLNDSNGISGLPDEDGALGNPGDTVFSKNQLTVTAIPVTTASGGQVPYAFAVYRAPVDFARPGGTAGSFKTGVAGFASSAGTGFGAAILVANSGPIVIIGAGSLTDDELASRLVSIQIQDFTNQTATALRVNILRPPVVMIHGLWDNWTAWNSFSPLVKGPFTVDPRFYVGRVSYDLPIGNLITASDPSYPDTSKARANSMGFGFNAPSVLAQTGQWIEDFKQGHNPLAIPAAAVQADIIAHSMGGDITRTLPLQPTFLSDDTFAQGNIHKVITIDTPHLGSQLASQLVSFQENGNCIQRLILAPRGKFAFKAVAFSTGFVPFPLNGAMTDLQPSSIALVDMASQSPHPLPTALIAGVYTNFGVLDTSPTALFIRATCFVFGDPLANALTSTGWPAIFMNQANDAVVSESSQLNGLDPGSGFTFIGYVHSPGTEALGFSGPSVLDAKIGAGDTVVFLLNKPVTQPSFIPLNP
jgi:probable HAF family extracellular repeat protein